MTTDTPLASTRRTVLRGALSLVALAVTGVWAFFAWFLFTFRCGDNCDGNDAESWIYPGQAVLAAVGVLLALAAIVLGFTSRRRHQRLAALGATVLLAAWLVWLFSGSF